MFGTVELRQKFFDLSKAELERRGVPWALVSGRDEARLANAIAAIERSLSVKPRSTTEKNTSSLIHHRDSILFGLTQALTSECRDCTSRMRSSPE